jgi:hypothetical protein
MPTLTIELSAASLALLRRKAEAVCLLAGIGAALLVNATAQPQSPPAKDPWTVDFRYAPSNWQTAICLPDDWQKTLVAKDGGLLYDYPGSFAGFGTKITFSVAAEAQWVKQELVSPRVPIVCTTKRTKGLEILEEAFAVAPPLAPVKDKPAARLALERVGSSTGQANWASPPSDCDPAFKHVAIGWAQPVRYRFKAKPGEHFAVVFGLCEGRHQQAGQRVLNLQIEGKTRQTVDMAAEKGRNVPALFPFAAHDENNDGWVDLAVAAAENSPDLNTILNVLWVFAGAAAPPAGQLLSGQSPIPALAHLDCGGEIGAGQPPRHDVLLVRLRNYRGGEARVVPALTIESQFDITADATQKRVRVGPATTVYCPQPWASAEQGKGKLVLQFAEAVISADTEKVLAFGIGRGQGTAEFPPTVMLAEWARKRARKYWEKLDLPYGRVEVPDAGVQALLDSAIRNIYQAREIKNGLPAFQVGPTCYRGLWVVDGSFLLEAMTYLGRTNETRSGIRYLLSFQREDGGFMLIDGHWKETGIALWAITRHARLTGDQAWLREVWPAVERGFAHIVKLRQMPAADAPNARLIPDGFSDGGLADKVPEYTNIYWTMAGMRAAVEAARWLGYEIQATAWQREYDDFYEAFRRAAQRDQRSDSGGHRYVPIRMVYDDKIPPQKAQWAFLHAVFPGKVFASDDPLVLGNLAMLKAVEQQGLVLDTGWLKNGIWNYFASFYAHAWLWLGDADKAARTLYAFGNHASPLLVWREEQMPVGKGDAVVGDMPHNWASAEFIRLVRHALVLERGNQLHLLEAMPAKWAQPGAQVRLRDILTEFGPLSLEFTVAKDGSTATLRLRPPTRTPPERLVLHLDNWSGRTGALELPVKPAPKVIVQELTLGR